MTIEEESSEVRRREKEAEAEAGTGANPKKLPYPKAIWFIVGNEFCERFSYYGMKAILSLYFKNKLHFSEDTATVVYHTFSLFCYFCPLFGAMLADQLLGKYRTIFWISIIYVLGHVLKTLAAIPTLGVPPVEFSLIGLALIAIGTGGIKPCVSAFGGDQFKMPEQERQLQTFFSVFYFAINSGALISTFITPILRQDVQCFGDDTCYSLAFGIPALLMLIATVILVMGKGLYVMKPPQGNILTKVFGSIWHALKAKVTTNENHDHWLDASTEKYGRHLVEDVKLLLRVLVMFIPLPVFWALFDQQGSRWTFQATRMDGALGSYIIKPDQMQLVNPALILILIPLFDAVVYPFCAKFNFMVKPLQRMTVGGLLTASAFMISGFLELELMKTYDRVPKVGESHFHIMNTLPCPVDVRLSTVDGLFNLHENLDDKMNNIIYDLSPGLYDLDVRVDRACKAISQYERRYKIEAKEEKVSGIVIRPDSDKSLHISELVEFEEPKKYSGGDTKLRVVFDVDAETNQTLYLKEVGGDKIIKLSGHAKEASLQETTYAKVHPGVFEAYMDDTNLGAFTFGQGGVHTLYVSGFAGQSHHDLTVQDYILTKENSVHMLWLIPQYFVITAGEIIFSVTGLEFSYSQAPESMKSVLQAAWLLTVAFGNLIVIIVAEAKAFEDQASEFFMFAGLMYVTMIVFAVMAYYYKYVDVHKREAERKLEEEELKTRKEASAVENQAFSDNTVF